MVGLCMKEWLRGDMVTWWLVCWTPGQEVGKTLYFHNASLHPELKIGTSKLLVKSGEMPGGGGTLLAEWQEKGNETLGNYMMRKPV